jgi:hypothetical protein
MLMKRAEVMSRPRLPFGYDFGEAGAFRLCHFWIDEN